MYENFDFLIHEKAHSMSTDYSVWLDGSKEFYDDIQALASIIRYQLSPLYVIGTEILNEFQKYQDIINNQRIFQLDRKLNEMREKILYDDFPRTKDLPNENHLSFVNETESESLLRVKIIERIFAEELAFLYYLNLNTFNSPDWSNYMKLSTEPGLIRTESRQPKRAPNGITCQR